MDELRALSVIDTATSFGVVILLSHHLPDSGGVNRFERHLFVVSALCGALEGHNDGEPALFQNAQHFEGGTGDLPLCILSISGSMTMSEEIQSHAVTVTMASVLSTFPEPTVVAAHPSPTFIIPFRCLSSSRNL